MKYLSQSNSPRLYSRTYLKNKSRHMLKNLAYTGDGTYKRSMDPARALLFHPLKANTMAEDVPGKTQGMFSTASYGCFEPEHPGKICRRVILRTRPATAGSRPGPGRGRSNRSLPNLARIFTSEGASIYVKLLSMAVSPPQKKGSFCRPYEAWQGDKDHGDRRRFWSSCRH